MSTTLQTLDTQQAEKRDSLVSRLFQTGLGALDIWAVYIGDRLGYYRVLADQGPTTSTKLAACTDTNERYTREWLEQQAVSGILTVEDPTPDAHKRRYALESGHAEVLLDRDSLSYFVPLFRYYVGTMRKIDDVLAAYRTGCGIAWGEWGDDIREGQEGFNRALYLRQLGTEDLPSVPDVDARLKADPPACVLDVGCGTGWSSVAIARAYPKVYVLGIDFDPPSIEAARRNATQARVADRVSFEVQDAARPAVSGRFDLVTILESLHDQPQPVDVLRAVRGLLADGGTVIVMEERVAEEFTAPGDFIDRMMYGWSIVSCLPIGMVGDQPAGTGTVMRPSILHRYAAEAGFREIEVLPIDNDPLRRWYRLLS
jgi:2-polyprenyl-3-methyl-5-hydroxy-6-metoxy-1,4-benzoquinol methylase